MQKWKDWLPEKFNLNQRGNIELAKIHSLANRPLKIIDENIEEICSIFYNNNTEQNKIWKWFIFSIYHKLK